MVEAMNCSIGQLKPVLQRIWTIMPERTTFISGPTGIGKSEVVRQAAQESGYGRVVDARLAGLLPEDIRGMPKAKGDFFEMILMDMFKPAFTNDKMVLFLDEVNQASSEVLSALFQLVYDREINGKKIGANVRIVAAGNLGDVYDVTQMSPALERRFIHINVTADKLAWLKYMRGKRNVDDGVLAFIEKRKEDTLAGVTEEATLSPAQWTAVSEYLWKVRDEEGEDAEQINHIIISGMIGKKLSVDLMRFLKTYKTSFDPSRIILEPSEKIIPEVKHMIEQGRNSYLAELCEGLVSILGSKYELSPTIGERVAAFIEALPPELSTKLILDLKNNVPDVFMHFPSDGTVDRIYEKNVGALLPDLPPAQ